MFGVAHVKFERARSIHLQAPNHRGPAAAGASPVSVLTSSHTRRHRQQSRPADISPQRGFTSPDKEKKNLGRASRTTCRSRVASPAYSFGPGVATATRSRAAPRSTTRSPTQTCYIKEKTKKNRTSLHFRSPGLAPSSVPAFAAALHEPCLPMSVASVAALRTAGSGRRRGAGSQQTGLNGERLRLCQVRETLSNRI